MGKDAQVYSKGDWIVHRQYGVGKVVGIDEKRLNKMMTRFYKVRTSDSTFWIPMDSVRNDRIGPLPSRNVVQQAIAVLKKPPRNMNVDYKKRRKRITRVKSEGTFLAIARLVRDLLARQSEKRLNQTEERALKLLSERLLEVWSIRMGIGVRDAYWRMFRWVCEESREMQTES